jgi:NAD(P)H-flavin reductase
MLDHLDRTDALPPKATFFYTTKGGQFPLDVDKILFLPKLVDIEARSKGRMSLRLFITDITENEEMDEQFRPHYCTRRLSGADLAGGLPTDRTGTICYVCGPPTMTDEVVEFFRSQEGMTAARVYCEKWW